ncbi:hypothetical protein BB559_003011, partial [Furculomyces boomerangus]
KQTNSTDNSVMHTSESIDSKQSKNASITLNESFLYTQAGYDTDTDFEKETPIYTQKQNLQKFLLERSTKNKGKKEGIFEARNKYLNKTITIPASEIEEENIEI